MFGFSSVSTSEGLITEVRWRPRWGGEQVMEKSLLKCEIIATITIQLTCSYLRIINVACLGISLVSMRLWGRVWSGKGRSQSQQGIKWKGGGKYEKRADEGRKSWDKQQQDKFLSSVALKLKKKWRGQRMFLQLPGRARKRRFRRIIYAKMPNCAVEQSDPRKLLDEKISSH